MSLTTGTWTSLQRITYMSLTTHFIDAKWKLHKKILCFCLVNSHKGDELGDLLIRCLIDWGLEKIYALTVDNASANDGLVRVLKDVVNKWGTTILGGKDIYMRCATHIIKLVVGEGTKEKEMNKFVTAIKAVVKYIRQSPMRDVDLHDLASRMRKKYKKYWGNPREMYGCKLDGKLDDDGPLYVAMVKCAMGMLFEEYKRSNYKKFKAANGRRAEKTMLEKYLVEDPKGENKDIDVLQWWKRNEHRFPMLATMAKDVLAVSISTVASKSAFITEDWLRDKAISDMEEEDLDKLDNLEKGFDKLHLDSTILE
ncbi:hypothetical protein SLEP1_g50642 [Rubroshorea leprosula]|uniref:HAT C-terminal dimerisation domain-containing protein n=1 Tax=Rubroshorea leprosula TaxID=152421 RepID=A0AAV5M0P0_9ROSI|nr:hypothetical protein SLEP1_g50642 [Rubroshorea leprosula]